MTKKEDLEKVIQKIVEFYLSEDMFVDRLIPQLGLVEKYVEGTGCAFGQYHIKPLDKRFSRICLKTVKKTQFENERSREWIELTLTQPTQLTIAAMVSLFGEYEKVIPFPRLHSPTRIGFYYDKKELPFLGSLTVTISTDPSAPDVKILEIMIMKNARA